jgi:hypothetical protein
MKTFFSIVWLVCVLTGCATSLHNIKGRDGGMILKIQWQRLLDVDGNTCDRCSSTHKEISKGVHSLRSSLQPLGINVILEEKSLSSKECAIDVSESNRIWLADRSLEEWLGAEVGQSLCGSCCSVLGKNVECRTVSYGGETYEVIPAELIVKAGLLAASQIMRAPSPEACCPSHGSQESSKEGCCPKSSADNSKKKKDSI